MEAVTAGATGAQGTGSKTIADLLPLAVRKYGDKPAQRYKAGDEWVDSTYAELGEVVREVSLGLIDLGIEPGDKVSILANTRPEWTHACFGDPRRRRHLVTIYQTNSPAECQYVLEHSDSKAVFVEDASSSRRSARSRTSCPKLEHVIVMDAGAAPTSATRCRSSSCASAAAAVTSPTGRRAARRSAARTTASISTRPAPPGRPRAACSRTRTTARSPSGGGGHDDRDGRLAPTCSCRSRTRSRS